MSKFISGPGYTGKGFNMDPPVKAVAIEPLIDGLLRLKAIRIPGTGATRLLSLSNGLPPWTSFVAQIGEHLDD